MAGVPGVPDWLATVLLPDRSDAYVGPPQRGELDPVFDRPEPEARAAVVTVYTHLLDLAPPYGGHLHLWNSRCAQVIQRAARRRWDWTLADVRTLWGAFGGYAARFPESRHELLRLPVVAAEAVRTTEPAEVTATVREAVAGLRSLTHDPRLDRRLRELHTPTVDAVAVLPDCLTGDDPLGAALRAAVEGRLDEPGVADLLDVLADHPAGVRPSNRWSSRARALLAEHPRLSGLALLLLDVVRHHDETEVVRSRYGHQWVETVFADEGVVPVLRGIAWTSGLVAQAASGRRRTETVAAMTATALACAAQRTQGEMGEMRSMPTVSSLVATLGTLDGDAAVTALLRLATTLRHRTVLQQVEKSLAAVAERAGLTAEELAERSVPRHDLAPGGRTDITLGDATATVVVARSVTVEWRGPSGHPVRSVPASVRSEHAEALAELRARVKAVGVVLGAERLRVEALLATERTWPVADWRAWYAEHPITGAHVRDLLWTSGGTTGFPVVDEDATGGWALVDVRGRRTPLKDDDEIRLWRPLDVTPDEVRAWRDLLADQQRTQPFKQAYREVYLLTPAEEETATYSHRFAGHVLDYRTLRGLVRARGWEGGHLGYRDDGFDAEATRVLGGRWRACFRIDLLESEQDGEVPRLCSTDRVRFERSGDEGWEPSGLASVPRPVLSEAMRDVDLFVGVASIATDPTWAEQRADDGAGHLGYWRNAAFGDLAESAVVRRDGLARLLPRLRIADRLRIDGRFLCVRGNLRDYRIHLGSGNVLMSPNDQYLCIVATPERSRDRVHLPFEGDGMLTVVLSKAFLLAADDEIEDATILQQLRG